MRFLSIRDDMGFIHQVAVVLSLAFRFFFARAERLVDVIAAPRSVSARQRAVARFDRLR